MFCRQVGRLATNWASPFREVLRVREHGELWLYQFTVVAVSGFDDFHVPGFSSAVFRFAASWCCWWPCYEGIGGPYRSLSFWFFKLLSTLMRYLLPTLFFPASVLASIRDIISFHLWCHVVVVGMISLPLLGRFFLCLLHRLASQALAAF